MAAFLLLPLLFSRALTVNSAVRESPAEASAASVGSAAVLDDVAAAVAIRGATGERRFKRPAPHIIFILADDLGWNDVGYHANALSMIRTPFIDRLAHNGVRLENYYVQPVCSPTRSQLMTGRYQIRMGIQHTNFSPGETLCLPLNETLLPEKLKEHGYATHAIGKWHLGFSKTACLPTRRGFDSFFGIILGTSDHTSYLKSTRVKLKGQKKQKKKKKFVSGNTFYENEEPTTRYQGRFSAELYAERAVQVIKNHNKEQPLFLYLPFQMVHRPNRLPKKYIKKYQGLIKNKDRKFYAGRVEALDQAVRNITRALRDYRLLQNSVIIFSTDNGGSTQHMANNWPLRGGKGRLWEGGVKAVGFVHSPLIPKRIRGTNYRGLMHVTDWLPTIIQGAAGINLKTMPNPLDGYNLWKGIRFGRPSPRVVLLHNINPAKGHRDWRERDVKNWGKLSKLPFNATIRAAIRIGDWKLITGGPGTGPRYFPKEHPAKIKEFVYKDRDPIRLYNVVDDPREIDNLALKYPERVFKMLRRLKHFHQQSLQPLEYHFDPMCDPDLHNKSWAPWLDDELIH